MRAIRFDGRHATYGSDAPEPEAGSGEAVVRVVCAGIAGADLAVVRGISPDPPPILGHELVGVVERAEPSPGRDRDRALVGQRVVASIEIACGRCDLCKRGLANHCREMSLLGLARRAGCLAERVAVPVRCLAPVPDRVDDGAAVFALGVGAALHAAQLVRLEGRGYITVLGDTIEAMLAAQAMARLNASVRLVGSDPARFVRAERWGIKHRHADDVGRRQDQDVVVDCTGSARGVELAMRLVRPRGTIIVGASAAPTWWDPDETGPDLSPLARHEIEVVGARGGKVQEAIAALAEGRFDVSGLITRRFRLSDGVAALRAASDAEQIKVVVDVSDGVPEPPGSARNRRG